MKLLLLGAVALSTLVAQPAIVGQWTIEYERGRQLENGVATPIMGTAGLSIVARGDSLVATLTPGPRLDGSQPPPSVMTGRLSGDTVTFVQKVQAQMTVNGEARTTELTLTWKLTARGDALGGTLQRDLPMMADASAPTSVKGSRKG